MIPSNAVDKLIDVHTAQDLIQPVKIDVAGGIMEMCHVFLDNENRLSTPLSYIAYRRSPDEPGLYSPVYPGDLEILEWHNFIVIRKYTNEPVVVVRLRDKRIKDLQLEQYRIDPDRYKPDLRNDGDCLRVAMARLTQEGLNQNSPYAEMHIVPADAYLALPDYRSWAIEYQGAYVNNGFTRGGEITLMDVDKKRIPCVDGEDGLTRISNNTGDTVIIAVRNKAHGTLS